MSLTVVLEVDAAACFTKTFVGPVAWLVFEHLALSAHDVGDELIADETARSIAEAVSVSKDTAAGALRRLVDAGLAERRPQRRSGGRFGAGGYLLRLPPGIARTSRATDVSAPRPTPSPPPDPPRPQRHDQLTLLDDPKEPQP